MERVDSLRNTLRIVRRKTLRSKDYLEMRILVFIRKRVIRINRGLYRDL